MRQAEKDLEIPCMYCGNTLSNRELQDRLELHDQIFSKTGYSFAEAGPTITVSLCRCGKCNDSMLFAALAMTEATPEKLRERLHRAREGFLRLLRTREPQEKPVGCPGSRIVPKKPVSKLAF